MSLYKDTFNKLNKYDKEFINPHLIATNYVCDTLLSNGITLNNEELKDLEKEIWKVIRTILSTNINNGVSYVWLDENNNINIVNPTKEVEITKEKGEIILAKFRHFDGKNYIEIELGKNYIKIDNKTTITNYGKTPIVEIKLREYYDFSPKNQLKNWYRPFNFNMGNNATDWITYDYNNIFTPLWATQPNFYKTINLLYSDFFERVKFEKPKIILTGASENTLDSFNSLGKREKDEKNIDLDNGLWTQSRGDDTKITTLIPNTKLNEFLSTIQSILIDWFTNIGLNYPVNTKATNKTQSEVENMNSLTTNTLRVIKESLTSGITDLINLYLFIENKDVDFEFQINEPKDNKGTQADYLTKLLAAQVISIPEARAELFNISLEEAKKGWEDSITDIEKALTFQEPEIKNNEENNGENL